MGRIGAAVRSLVMRDLGLVRDAATYVVERGLALILSAVASVVVARYLGPSAFGLLQFATTVFITLGTVALLGMPAILVKEASTRPEGESLLASAMAVQVPAAVVASAVGCGLVVWTKGATLEVLLLAAALAPLPLFGLEGSLRSLLEAKGEVRSIARSGIASSAIGAASKIGGVLLSAPLWVFAFLTSVTSLVLAVGLSASLRAKSHLKRLRNRVDAQATRSLLRESWPLLVASVAVMLYMRVDIVMLGLMAGDAETGIYSAAARLSEVWYFLPVAAMAAVRPRLARLYADGDGAEYDNLTQKFLTSSFGVALVVGFLTWAIADDVIGTTYGEGFAASAGVLRIHIGAAPFVFLGVAASQWFVDRGLTRFTMRRSITGAIVNLGLNAVLIPSMGATGAAIATLASYAMSAVLLNAFASATREVFYMQLRSLVLRWPTGEALKERR